MRYCATISHISSCSEHRSDLGVSVFNFLDLNYFCVLLIFCQSFGADCHSYPIDRLSLNCESNHVLGYLIICSIWFVVEKGLTGRSLKCHL